MPAGIEPFKGQSMKNLDEILKAWKTEVPEHPAFKREVWRRIERRISPDGRFEIFLAWLTRPQIASLVAVLSILGGAWVGSATPLEAVKTAYLHAVNPYAQVFLMDLPKSGLP
jgi:hypothetical protein